MDSEASRPAIIIAAVLVVALLGLLVYQFAIPHPVTGGHPASEALHKIVEQRTGHALPPRMTRDRHAD